MSHHTNIPPIKIIPARDELVGFVGPFTHWHNNKPTPFNPEYDPRARDWATLATYDCILAGVYELPFEQRKPIRDAFYAKRKAQGDVNPNEVKLAQKQSTNEVNHVKQQSYLMPYRT